MTKEKLMALLHDPRQTGLAVDELYRLIEDYPYFHTGHLLYLKGLQQTDALKMAIQLQVTALNARDRDQLYQYIHHISPQVEHQNIAAPAYPEPSFAQPTFSQPNQSPDDDLIQSERIIDNHQLLNVLLRQEKSEQSHTEEIISASSDSGVYSEQQLVVGLKKIAQLRSDSSETQQIDYVAKEGEGSADVAVTEKKDRVWSSAELVDFFLKANPKIVPKDSQFEVDLSESLQENCEIATETLADIYVSQGHKDKAIEIYTQLILKYPQKNIYFAAQIERLKNS